MVLLVSPHTSQVVWNRKSILLTPSGQFFSFFDFVVRYFRENSAHLLVLLPVLLHYILPIVILSATTTSLGVCKVIVMLPKWFQRLKMPPRPASGILCFPGPFASVARLPPFWTAPKVPNTFNPSNYDMLYPFRVVWIFENDFDISRLLQVAQVLPMTPCAL